MPFHILATADPMEVIDVYEQSAALQIAVVDRMSVKSLSDEWNQPGVYILLDRHQSDGTWGVYVGKAPAGIRNRIYNHLSNKDHWYRAILIKRDTTHGFNSAHTAWLEGRLYDLLNEASQTVLHNSQRPGDDTLASYDLPMLESTVEPISRLLKILGHDASTISESEAASEQGVKNKYYGVTLSDLISAGILKGDEKLISTRSTVPGLAQIHQDGQVEFQGKLFSTPSGAAIAARGGAANGWNMWAIQGSNGLIRLSTLRARYQADRKNP